MSLSVTQYADEMFQLTDSNREYLKHWLPWLDSILQPDDTKQYIRLQIERFANGEAVHQTIFYRDKIAGVVAFKNIDHIAGIGHVGYWLGKEYCGKGIMLTSVMDIISQGFTFWKLQKIEIRCAIENHKSRAIPEKLGFTNEGIIRNAEKVYDRLNDHVVYGFFN